MRRTTTALILTIGAALLAPLAARAAEPVKIGVAIAQTGPFAPAAIPTLKAYQLWVEQTNAAGGLDVAGTKRPIDLIVYDDQSDFTKEATIYEKLITDDKVDLLLSPYATPAHFALGRLARAIQVSDGRKHGGLVAAEESETRLYLVSDLGDA